MLTVDAELVTSDPSQLTTDKADELEPLQLIRTDDIELSSPDAQFKSVEGAGAVIVAGGSSSGVLKVQK